MCILHCNSKEYENNAHLCKSSSWCLKELGRKINDWQDGPSKQNQCQIGSAEFLERCKAILLKCSNSCHHQKCDNQEQEIVPQKCS